MDELELILERVDSGERLTSQEALTLLGSDRVLEIGRAADRIRQRLHPDGIVSFIIDRNVNYTNICSAFCKFCAFFRAPGSSEGYLLELDQIYKKIDEALALGGTGILLQGGLHPDLKIEFYEDLLRRLRERYPTVHLHCFSPPEIYNIAQVSGLSIQETIRRLKEAGLQSVPGGGAEILDDDYRPQILRDKCTGAQWIDIMETAHRLGLRTTATMMVGTGERDEHRVRHLEMIRDLQDRTGGFTAFIPWTFQADNTYLQKKAHLQDVGGFPYLRLVAVCRIYLDNIR
ncbi:MAG: CofH family radical SAM protein, partial [Acidobacteria bacterium]|nr:CofH family radical SAM protein [Acidobacteriota bacterium]